MRHVAACNNARLPGRRRKLLIAGQHAGWVLPEAASLVGTSIAADGLQAAARVLVGAGLCGWRDEAFDVRAEPSGAVLGQVDRGALPVLGLMAAGAHLNGLVQRTDGLHLWVAKRAPNKKLDPGKFDHVAAGGVPAGLTPLETLVKEAAEEAGLEAEMVAAATPTGVISYMMERPEGLRRDRLHCYDVILPSSFRPVAIDGEVDIFDLWPIERAVSTVRDTDLFKFNVNLVLIDLFLRLGLIADPGLRAALHDGEASADVTPRGRTPLG